MRVFRFAAATDDEEEEEEDEEEDDDDEDYVESRPTYNDMIHFFAPPIIWF